MKPPDRNSAEVGHEMTLRWVGLIGPSAVAWIVLLAISSCHINDRANDESQIVGEYRVARGNWSSQLTLKGDHTAVQSLTQDGKMVNTVSGKWEIREAAHSIPPTWVSISLGICLRDNPRDYPFVRMTEALWGREMQESLPIELDSSSRVSLVIDEEEDNLKFVNQEARQRN